MLDLQLQSLAPEDTKSRAEAMLRDLANAAKPVHKKEKVKAVLLGRSSPTLWGRNCDVGRHLRTQLETLTLSEPLPIQDAAFNPIRDGHNVVMASETGSGKTLGFLLPLLTGGSWKKKCFMMVIVPSLVLAEQVKRVVDTLWEPSTTPSGGIRPTSQIIGDEGDVAKEVDWTIEDPKERYRTEARAALMSIGDAAVMIGTPTACEQLVNEAMQVLTKAQTIGLNAGFRTVEAGIDKASVAQAELLITNLRAIVLDEADLLLNSAGYEQSRKAQKEFRANNEAPRGKLERTRYEKKLRKLEHKPTKTGALLAKMPKSLRKLQFICASATAGQTLRRQLRETLQVPEKPVVLVSGTEEVAEDDEHEHGTVLPSLLNHRYMLTEKKADDVDRAEHVSKSIIKAMNQLPPRRSMVFVGGDVNKIANILREKGMKDVQIIREMSSDKEEDKDTSETLKEDSDSDEEAIDSQTSKLLDQLQSEQDKKQVVSWATTPIYLGTEKYGRGLDFEVDYVFIASPPSSSATYAHLAGRTARNGRKGTAITILEPYQAPRVVAFAEHLGLSFKPLGEKLSS